MLGITCRLHNENTADDLGIVHAPPPVEPGDLMAHRRRDLPRRLRGHESVSISYFLVLLIGFGLWFAYGVAASNLALIVPNVIAAIVMVATIGVAFRYR